MLVSEKCGLILKDEERFGVALRLFFFSWYVYLMNRICSAAVLHTQIQHSFLPVHLSKSIRNPKNGSIQKEYK